MTTVSLHNEGNVQPTKPMDRVSAIAIAIGSTLLCSVSLIRYSKYYQHLIDGGNAFATQLITAGFGPAITFIAVGMYRWYKSNNRPVASCFSALYIAGMIWFLAWYVYAWL